MRTCLVALVVGSLSLTALAQPPVPREDPGAPRGDQIERRQKDGPQRDDRRKAKRAGKKSPAAHRERAKGRDRRGPDAFAPQGDKAPKARPPRAGSFDGPPGPPRNLGPDQRARGGQGPMPERQRNFEGRRPSPRGEGMHRPPRAEPDQRRMRDGRRPDAFDRPRQDSRPSAQRGRPEGPFNPHPRQGDGPDRRRGFDGRDDRRSFDRPPPPRGPRPMRDRLAE